MEIREFALKVEIKNTQRQKKVNLYALIARHLRLKTGGEEFFGGLKEPTL
jgi:hypothetical protein